MAFPRLITDNTVELLKEDDRVATTRPAKDDEEFFEFLKDKVLIDFNRMLDEKNIDKKINALADLYTDIDEYANVLGKRELFIDGLVKDWRE